MKLASLVLLTLLSGSAMAQADACGGESLANMQATADAATDPQMQQKYDRVLASMQASYDRCMATLAQREKHDRALGIVADARPAPASDLPTEVVAQASGKASCSVVDDKGKPCVQKMSEQTGIPGNSDTATYQNACPYAIEVSAVFKDGSHGAATVKGGKVATLLCDDCGGVASIETRCK